MIEKLEELKNKSEELLKYNYSLRKFTIKISNPKKKNLLFTTFLTLFILILLASIARYVFLSHSPNYNIPQLIFGSFMMSIIASLILTTILAFPIIFALNARKSIKFNNYKIELDSILEDIKEIYSSLNDYPEILEDYLSPFYLNKLIGYLKEKETTIEEAVNKLDEEIYTNKQISYQVNIANKRIANSKLLFKLSVSEGVIDSYDNWLQNYSL